MTVCPFLSSWYKTVSVWRKQNNQGYTDSYDSVQVRWAMKYVTCISGVQSSESFVLLGSWKYSIGNNDTVMFMRYYISSEEPD